MWPQRLWVYERSAGRKTEQLSHKWWKASEIWDFSQLSSSYVPQGWTIWLLQTTTEQNKHYEPHICSFSLFELQKHLWFQNFKHLDLESLKSHSYLCGARYTGQNPLNIFWSNVHIVHSNQDITYRKHEKLTSGTCRLILECANSLGTSYLYHKIKNKCTSNSTSTCLR